MVAPIGLGLQRFNKPRTIAPTQPEPQDMSLTDIKILFMLDQIKTMCKYLDLLYVAVDISGSDRWRLIFSVDTNSYKVSNGVWNNIGEWIDKRVVEPNWSKNEHRKALADMYRTLFVQSVEKAEDSEIYRLLAVHGIEKMPEDQASRIEPKRRGGKTAA